MKTISIINLKGGVAKTLTADSMAHVLATLHNKRVLLVDNDKQGNTSKAFGVHSYDDKSISDVLTARRLDPREVIKKTRFENIDVMPANMTLIRANMEVLMDSTRPQQTRLRSALNAIAEENFYDFCIIDNAPDINISTINALVASDDVIIPIKIDKYAFDGLEELKEQIEDTRDDLNPRLRLAGCLITCFIRADAEKQGEAWLRSRPEYPVFDTRIRYSDKVTESTFSEIPIVEYSRRSGTAMDYIAFVQEYLRRGISFIIDPNVVTATKKDIEDHDASKTAHAAEFEKKADVTDLNAHANNTDIHVNPSTMGNYDTAISGLIEHKEDTKIHVTAEEKASWTEGAEQAAADANRVTEALNAIAGIESRVSRVEDGLFNNITGNPFLASFDSLDGITLVKGIWNEERKRIEC